MRKLVLQKVSCEDFSFCFSGLRTTAIYILVCVLMTFLAVALISGYTIFTWEWQGLKSKCQLKH